MHNITNNDKSINDINLHDNSAWSRLRYDFQAIRRKDFSTKFSQTIRWKLTDYSTVYNSTDRLFDGKTIRRKDHSTETSLSLSLSDSKIKAFLSATENIVIVFIVQRVAQKSNMVTHHIINILSIYQVIYMYQIIQ